MRSEKSSRFAELVFGAANHVGNSAPKVADEIIGTVFPETWKHAISEGASKPLRVGLISEVKRILRNGHEVAGQIDLAEISDAFRPIVSRLKSKSYFVETADEYVPVDRLIAEPALLDDARRFMRRKGEECLAEAKALDELYEAVTA